MSKLQNRPDISIIVPVYNEEESISKVIDKILKVNYKKMSFELVIVDDGSNDKTAEILRRHPKKNKFRTISFDQNRGKGAVVREGIWQSRGKVVVIQDADLEYDPLEVPKLVSPILLGKTKVVYGSRFMGKIKRMTPLRRLANVFLTKYINFIYGTKISDACTCYKIFKSSTVKGFNLSSNGFEFCHELTANVCFKRLKITEIPITYKARDNSETIKSSWIDLVKQLFIIAKFRFLIWQG